MPWQSLARHWPVTESRGNVTRIMPRELLARRLILDELCGGELEIAWQILENWKHELSIGLLVLGIYIRRPMANSC